MVEPRYDFPGQRIFRAFVLVPFVLPTVVVAAAFWGDCPGGPGVELGRAGRTDPARARLLQRRGRRARRSAASGRTSTRGLGSGRDARRRHRRSGTSWRHLPAARAGARGGRVDRLPLHVHLVRVVVVLAGSGHGTLETEIYNQARGSSTWRGRGARRHQIAAVAAVVLVSGGSAAARRARVAGRRAPDRPRRRASGRGRRRAWLGAAPSSRSRRSRSLRSLRVGGGFGFDYYAGARATRRRRCSCRRGARSSTRCSSPAVATVIALVRRGARRGRGRRAGTAASTRC